MIPFDLILTLETSRVKPSPDVHMVPIAIECPVCDLGGLAHDAAHAVANLLNHSTSTVESIYGVI